MDSDAQHTSPDDHADKELAQALGWSPNDLVEALGGGWRRHRLQFDDDELAFLDWYVAGDPVQLMLVLDGVRGRVGLAAPEGRWSGPGRLVHVPRDGEVTWFEGATLAEQAPAHVAALQRRRRRTFRWCRSCRRLTPPEERMDVDQCMSCSSRWDGTVF